MPRLHGRLFVGDAWQVFGLCRGGFDNGVVWYEHEWGKNQSDELCIYGDDIVVEIEVRHRSR
jgi:hypothetical protein